MYQKCFTIKALTSLLMKHCQIEPDNALQKRIDSNISALLLMSAKATKRRHFQRYKQGEVYYWGLTEWFTDEELDDKSRICKDITELDQNNNYEK